MTRIPRRNQLLLCSLACFCRALCFSSCRSKSTSLLSVSNSADLFGPSSQQHEAFGSIVRLRYSCKKFRRYDHSNSTTGASESDPTVVKGALHALDLARRTPTAFNTQPYKVVLVHSKEQKTALSKYCLGPNAQRILDSDCTAIFLADKQITRTFGQHRRLLERIRDPTKAPLSRFRRLQMQFYITIFSSGLPLPRILSAPITFVIRAVFGFVHAFTSRFYPLPSLASAETWSSKQAMMVAITYMLGCTSLGLATLPMEGFNARGIRRVIRAPSRFAVPLIVSTGRPCKETPPITQDDRYSLKELVFSDTFGNELAAT